MTRKQVLIAAAFLGSLLAFPLAWGVADAILFARAGESVSWSMDLLGHRIPFVAFVVGHLSGGLLWGLAAHFWAGLGSPSLYRDLDRLRSDNAALRSLAFEDWSTLHPDVPPDEAAARFDLAVAVRAAGLARGDGGIAGDQN